MRKGFVLGYLLGAWIHNNKGAELRQESKIRLDLNWFGEMREKREGSFTGRVANLVLLFH